MWKSKLLKTYYTITDITYAYFFGALTKTAKKKAEETE